MGNATYHSVPSDASDAGDERGERCERSDGNERGEDGERRGLRSDTAGDADDAAHTVPRATSTSTSTSLANVRVDVLLASCCIPVIISRVEPDRFHQPRTVRVVLHRAEMMDLVMDESVGGVARIGVVASSGGGVSGSVGGAVRINVCGDASWRPSLRVTCLNSEVTVRGPSSLSSLVATCPLITFEGDCDVDQVTVSVCATPSTTARPLPGRAVVENAQGVLRADTIDVSDAASVAMRAVVLRRSAAFRRCGSVMATFKHQVRLAERESTGNFMWWGKTPNADAAVEASLPKVSFKSCSGRVVLSSTG